MASSRGRLKPTFILLHLIPSARPRLHPFGTPLQSISFLFALLAPGTSTSLRRRTPPKGWASRCLTQRLGFSCAFIDGLLQVRLLRNNHRP